jgi:hypothetical protein
MSPCQPPGRRPAVGDSAAARLVNAEGASADDNRLARKLSPPSHITIEGLAGLWRLLY